MRFKTLLFLIIIGFMLLGCGPQQKKDWRIAIPTNNSRYENRALLLKKLFLQKNLDLTIIKTESGIDASHLVIEGKADFTLTLGHSDFLIPVLGDGAKELRVAMPLFENVLFIFYRSPKDPTSIIEVVQNSKILQEATDSLSERTLGLNRFFGMLNIKNYEFVSDSSKATVIPIWGSFSGEFAKQMLAKNWKIYSMEESFIDFARIIEPRFGRLTIPGKYSNQPNQKDFGYNTLLSTGYLVTGQHLSKTDLYDVIKMIYENRVFFTSRDKTYLAIREDFPTRDLNYPLHDATVAFLKRNEPDFMERHAEYYGLLLTLVIVSIGLVQSIRKYLKDKKKDRIDIYFLNSDQIINDKSLTTMQRQEQLESLHTKALNQMVHEKLTITDFSIFSQMVRSEIIQLSKSEG